MSDWSENIAAAESEAERRQAAEHEAESRFDTVHAQAQARGAVDEALASQEFSDWMSARHATDAAWGNWSLLMDSKPKD